MDLNFDLDLVQSQKILLTPRLKQALDMLRMSSQELYEYIEEQLEENPILEVIEDGDCTDDKYFINLNDDLDWKKGMEEREEFEEQYGGTVYDINKFAVYMPRTNLSLKEHLLLQLHTSGLDDHQVYIGEYIIDNIDENGYLTVELAEIAKFFNVGVNKVSKVLAHMQTFDPPGICARNLKECLLIQLRQKNIMEKNIRNIIENYLDHLAEGKVDLVSDKTGLDKKVIQEIFDYIKTLEPKPGREFYDNYDVKYIIPDVIVKNTKNNLEIQINDDSIPLIIVNENYKRILSCDVSSEVKKFIQNKIDNARWLIKCLEQRKEIIRKVAECIIKKQADFFEKGVKHIKPATIKDVAEDVKMHESMVVSTINGKYIQCMWGIFEMKYFFEKHSNLC